MQRACAPVVAALVCVLAAAANAAAQVAPDGWVVLAVDEYRALRLRAVPPAPPPAPPPVETALTRIDYDLRVDTESAAGRAVLTIDVLKDGWVRVPIPPGVMVRDARLDGQRVTLSDGTPPYLVLSRPGRSILTLDIVLPIAQNAGAESVSLPASPSPVSQLTIALPKSGIDLAVGGGFIAERSESAVESRWVAYGRPNQPLTVSWKRRIEDRRAAQPLRVRARITEIVGLGEETCQVTASVRVEIVQGLAREVSLALPPGLVINQVSGATVADWDTNGAALRVSLLEPAADEISFVISGEMRVPREGRVDVPLVRVPSAERETGGVGVDVMGAGEIGGREPRGLEPADPSELSDVLAGRDSPSIVAYRMKPLAGTDPRSLAVAVVRYTPQAVLVANVEEARYSMLAAEDGWLLVEARYAIRNNQRSFLKVTLGADSTVWSAAVAGRPIHPGLASAGEILLPLEKGRAGEEASPFVVEVVYLHRLAAWSDKARARIDFPALDLPISRTGVTLHYSPRFRVDPRPGSFRVEVDPGPSIVALRDSASRDVRGAAEEKDAAGSALQALVDRFKNESGRRTVAGILPVRVSVPEYGPSIFLASELTAESRAPAIELDVRRAKD